MFFSYLFHAQVSPKSLNILKNKLTMHLIIFLWSFKDNSELCVKKPNQKLTSSCLLHVELCREDSKEQFLAGVNIRFYQKSIWKHWL